MNLNSYTRLNPYFEDGKESETPAQREYALVTAFGAIVALTVVGAWAGIRFDVVRPLSQRLVFGLRANKSIV